MSDQIIGLHHWFDSPPGRYLLAWEQARFDEAVANIFGYHSLQLGMPLLDGLRANRMPHQWLAMGQEAVEGSIAFVETGGVDGPLQRRAVDLLTEPVALPFPAASLDLLVLPHTLELSIDPHAALRDWLRLLNFEVESARFGCYRPAVRTAHWLERFGWMDPLGERWWPILGAAYFLVAVKRVHGMRLLEPAWRTHRQRAAGTVPIANRASQRGVSSSRAAPPAARHKP